VSTVLLRGMSFITLPVFSRIMTQAEYGEFSIYLSWVSILSIITTLTVWGGYFNAGIVHEEDKDRFVSISMGLSMTCVTIAYGAVYLFKKHISQLIGMPEILLDFAFIEILFSVPLNIWNSKETHFFRYKARLAISAGISVLTSVLGIFAVFRFPEYRVEARILSNLIPNAIVGGVFFVLNLQKGKQFFQWKKWKSIFAFNLVLIFHYLSMQVLSQSDRIMIGSMIGADAAGMYSVAYNFSMLLNLVTNGVNTSITPFLYRELKKNDSNDIRHITTGIVLLVAAMAMMVICVLPDLYGLILPETYYPALWAIPPVVIAAFFMFLYPMFGAVEFYYMENRFITTASMIGAVLNVVLNKIMIPKFGFIAAAYTTLFCYIAFSVCHYLFASRLLRKNKSTVRIFDIKALLVISVCLLGMMLLMLKVYEMQLARYSIIAIVIVSMWFNRRSIMNNLLIHLRRNG